MELLRATPRRDIKPNTSDICGALTLCGILSLVMLNRVQALPHLAFPPSMEPLLVFWYDKPQLLRTVE